MASANVTTDLDTDHAALVATAADPAEDQHREVRSDLPTGYHASYTTRHAARSVAQDPASFHLLSGLDVRPSAGDVVIARVSAIGNHKRIETAESRKAILFEGRLVMLAYGHRYAADQFLAHVPDTLEAAHLVAAGGIAGVVTAAHAKVAAPTQIEPLGLLADDQGVVNIARFAPYRNAPAVERGAGSASSRPEVIAVLGTSMNSGKSTVMACLINGLSNAGMSVGAGKITGTGAGNDPMIYGDAGAAQVLDFTDYGYPTTFRTPMEEIRSLTVTMVEDLTQRGTDVIVVEIADGVYQEETARLLRDEVFQATVDHVVFAATDALGARAGVKELVDAGLRVSATSGVLTSSPLASAEARAVLSPFDVPVIGTFDLQDPVHARTLLTADQGTTA